MVENRLGIQIETREEIANINTAVTALEAITDPLTLPMAAIEDLAAEALLADVITKVNALLAALRTAGLLDTGV